MGFKIVYMGTPEFAVEGLRSLKNSGIEIAAVVTATDKPAGRGQKLTPSAVKEFALENHIPVLQPEKLKDPEFIAALKEINADLFVVVAFRMLPEMVWNMPKYGTINLHASLLPQYRGAAPINWAVINGEKESGVTTFFIRQEIDTGHIIEQRKVEISDTDTAGILHDKLMVTGAELLVKTVTAIRDGKSSSTPQESLITEGTTLKSASKIFKEDCHINWNRSTTEVYNLIRGLSPYPAAFSIWKQVNKEDNTLKIFSSEKDSKCGKPGSIETDDKSYLRVFTSDGSLLLKELQQAGKKKMTIEEFLRGTKIDHASTLC